MKTTLYSKKAIGYSFLFLLSLIFRFNQLQIPLLSEKEAAIALQAVSGVSGFSGGLPGTTGFSAILSMVFFIFGKSEFIARLIPAIFGVLLILAPICFLKVIGKKTAVILSVLLMFDPGLVAFSRQVNGAMLSVCGLVFAFGFIINRKFIPAGIAAGIALLGSPIIWPGLFAFGLALWLTSFSRGNSEQSEEDSLPFFDFTKNELVYALFASLLTVAVLGSAFFTHLNGIAAPVLNLMAYIKGWVSTTELSPVLMLISFLLYQPFVLILGLFEGLRYFRSDDRINPFLIRWFFLSLLVAIFYPSKGMESLLISYIPLLALTARCIFRIIQSLEKPDIPAFGQMVLVVLLIPFSWLNIIVLQFPIEGQDATLRAAAAVGALALLIIASFLIRLGWPPKQAQTGIWMGLLVVTGIFTLSTAWRSAGLGLHPEAELWNYDGVSSELDLLDQTAGDLSEWNVSSREGINIVILDYPSSALKWALRGFTSVNEDKYLPSLSNPAIVITTMEQVPSLADAYRGQDFVLTRKTSWSLILPEEWIKWYAFRVVPSETRQIILWARTDLFPGAAKTAPATINPIQ